MDFLCVESGINIPDPPHAYDQGEGMGLLQYHQAMPSLHDVAHGGWLCTVHLLYNSSWKFRELAAGQLLSGQPVRYGKGRRYGPSITNKITPAGRALLQQARRAAVFGPAL